MISNITGCETRWPDEYGPIEPESNRNPGDISLATAYASLVAEDPDTVTPYHLKMLRSRFSVEQIQDLNSFIKLQLKQA